MFLGISWANLYALFFLPVFVAAVFLLLRHYSRTNKFVQKLIYSFKSNSLLKHFSKKRFLLKTVVMVLALFFLFIAMLRPQWNKKEQTVAQEGRDLLVVLDISRSMLAQDLKPNRIEFVKLKIRALLQKLKFERVGLLLFSGTAFVQCPLTIDYKTFLMFLDQVDVETIASGTTAIDGALKKAIGVFDKIPERKNKLVLLVTDGEDFSVNLDPVKKTAKEKNITVLTLGIGTEQGAPIPIVDARGRQKGYESDKKGNVVLSKLNETLLQKISDDLHGCYVRSSYDDSDLEDLVDFIGTFEKEQLADKKFSLYEDKYPIFLSIAWIFLALEWIL